MYQQKDSAPITQNKTAYAARSNRPQLRPANKRNQQLFLMKVLSIRQPFAWAIAKGIKTIENRTWTTNYRGPLLIHASKSKADMTSANLDKIKRHYQDPLPINEINSQKGHIIAIATLEQITRLNPNDPRFHPWAIQNQYHWMLANAKAFPEPIAAKGRLGLWDYPPQSQYSEHQPEKCQTCILGPTPLKLAPGKLEEILNYASKGTQHGCHSNENRACRGVTDIQLRLLTLQGHIEAPTDEAFKLKNQAYLQRLEQQLQTQIKFAK